LEDGNGQGQTSSGSEKSLAAGILLDDLGSSGRKGSAGCSGNNLTAGSANGRRGKHHGAKEESKNACCGLTEPFSVPCY
jgi:hypothetical protein